MVHGLRSGIIAANTCGFDSRPLVPKARFFAIIWVQFPYVPGRRQISDSLVDSHNL